MKKLIRIVGNMPTSIVKDVVAFVWIATFIGAWVYLISMLVTDKHLFNLACAMIVGLPLTYYVLWHKLG